MTVSAPRWDMTNVYPSLDSKQFKAAVKKYKAELDELESFFKKAGKADSKTDPKKLGKLLGDSVDRFNALFELSGTINPFIYSFVTTDSRNKEAMRALSEFEQMSVQASILNTRSEDLAIAPVAFASSDYGWVQIKGAVDKINVAGGCVKNINLWSTTTAGQLDDATASHFLVMGINLQSTNPSSTATTLPGFIAYPMQSFAAPVRPNTTTRSGASVPAFFCSADASNGRPTEKPCHQSGSATRVRCPHSRSRGIQSGVI